MSTISSGGTNLRYLRENLGCGVGHLEIGSNRACATLRRRKGGGLTCQLVTVTTQGAAVIMPYGHASTPFAGGMEGAI